MTNQIAYWMPLSVILPKEKAEVSFEQFKAIVSQIDDDLGIKIACMLNTIVSNPLGPSHAERQAKALSFCSPRSDIAEKISTYLRTDKSPFFLSRRHLMELMKWLAAFGAENELGKEKPIDMTEYIVAATTAAELRAAEHDALLSKSILNEDAESRLKRALPALREMSLWGLTGKNSLHALGRAKILLEEGVFSNEAYRKEFQKQTQLELEQFFVCITAVACVGIPIDYNSLSIQFTRENLYSNCPSYKDAFETFLSQFTCKTEDLKRDVLKKNIANPSDFYDYKHLRERPIFESKDGFMAIADLDFFQQCVALGPLFRILGLGAANVFSTFGQHFENYVQRLVVDLNGGVPEKQRGHVSGNPELQNKTTGVKREVSDVTVTFDDSIVLMESKAVWLKDQILTETNPGKFWEHIREKYGVSIDKANNKDERKGVAQLADSIKALAHKDTTLSDSKVFTPAIKRVFPVLVVHDHLLSTTGFANILATDFARLLEQKDFSTTGYFDYNGLQIANLFVATINEIESLAGTGSELSIQQHLETMNSKDPSRVWISVQDYVSQFVPDKKQGVSPLIKLSQDMMNRAARILFGEAADPQLASHKEISEAAYFRWINRGCHHGADWDDWYNAEKETRRTPVSMQG